MLLISYTVITLLLLTGCTSSWFYRPNDKQYMQLSELSSEVPVMVNSKSGNQIQTLFIPAENKNNPRLLVHFHGNAGNISWTAQRYLWLKDYGYDLLVFDYSGYGASSGSPSPEVLAKDAATILEYVLKKDSQSPWESITLAGTSLGGNVLLMALSEFSESDHFDLVFIDSSFLSFVQVAKNVVSSKPGGMLVSGLADWVISDDFAPASQLPLNLKQPLIVAHCKTDRLIGVELGREIYEKVTAPEKYWLLLENCPHAQGLTKKYPENQQKLKRVLDVM